MSSNDVSVFTLEEAAEFLKISETTLYQLVRSGKIPSRKVGREWRFLKHVLVEWLMKPTEEEEMNEVVQIDQFGGEYMVEDGQEKVALWIPLSREEKGMLMKKAVAENTSVPKMVVEFLRNWLENK